MFSSAKSLLIIYVTISLIILTYISLYSPYMLNNTLLNYAFLCSDFLAKKMIIDSRNRYSIYIGYILCAVSSLILAYTYINYYQLPLALDSVITYIITINLLCNVVIYLTADLNI